MRLEGKNAAEGGETGNLDIHGDLTEHRPAAGQADMRVFYGFDALPHFVRPTVTVGSYDGVHSGVYLDGSPDFVRLAGAYGIRARAVSSNAQAEEAIGELLADDRPYLLQCDVSPDYPSL